MKHNHAGIFLCTFLSLCILNPLFAKGSKDSATPAAKDGPRQTVLMQESPKPDILRMSVLNGPSGVGMAYLFEHTPDLDGVFSSFEVSASPQVLLPKLLKGEVDAGMLPLNVAAKVYTANNGAVLLAGITGNGMLSIIGRDTSIKALGDLKGKKLAAAGQGGTPEYMIRYLARSEGVEIDTAEGIGLDFSVPTAEIVPALVSGKIEYALVPEPFSTLALMQNQGIQRLIDIQKLYAEVSGSENYPVTALVVRKEFAEKYPDTLRLFLTACKRSIEWTNVNPKEAGELTEKHTLGLKAPVAAASVPASAFVWQNAAESRPHTEKLLSLFLEFAPQSVGGKLPDDGFYLK